MEFLKAMLAEMNAKMDATQEKMDANQERLEGKNETNRKPIEKKRRLKGKLT
jgi:uncharacterized coiled-coil protein SlyX